MPKLDLKRLKADMEQYEKDRFADPGFGRLTGAMAIVRVHQAAGRTAAVYQNALGPRQASAESVEISTKVFHAADELLPQSENPRGDLHGFLQSVRAG